jgi:hypothetical protein
MRNRSRSFAALSAVALALSVAVPMHGVESTNLHTNRLSFSGPVRLPGITLPAGSYLFERVEPTNRDVVVVRSHDRTRTYFMAATLRRERPANLPAGQLVDFGETRRGDVPMITAWYPDGERMGHGFVYDVR